MQDTAGEAKTNSSVMYSYGPPHMAKQKQDDKLEHTYSSYVRIRDVTLKTCQKQWMIGRSGERGSRISVLAARHDDDIDMCVCVCVNCKHMLLITFLNDPELIFLHTDQLFQVLPFNSDYSIQYYSFICTQLDDSKYCYVSVTIELNISHLFTHS